MSLDQLLRRNAQSHGSKLAVITPAGQWSYAELDRAVNELAAGLSQRGIQAGDRVAFLLQNCLELVVIDLACFRLGAVAVPLNVRLKGPEIAYILNHCQARFCIAHPELYPALAAVRDQIPNLEACFVVSESAPESAETYQSLLVSGEVVDPAQVAADAPAAILYTSGTTAKPKGVTHTHKTLLATIRNYVSASRMQMDEVVLGMLSMSHVFGFTAQMLSPLSVGGTVVIPRSFDPQVICELIVTLRATHLYGLPVVYEALVRYPGIQHVNVSSLRYCLAGGDSVSTTLTQTLRDATGLELHEGCGMTEVIPYTLNRPGLKNKVGSIGPVSIGMEVRVVDDVGNQVTPGQTGEMLVRSEALMAGYWNDPAATAAAIDNGWFHTGDLGRIDEDGYYWFVGRKKEIIVRGGSNIAPPEVEGVLLQHPAVREAAVVGAPHETWRECVVAYVSLHAGASVSQNELQSFVGERIATYKVPERITFLPELPRGLTGKVHRQTLKALAADAG